MRTTMIVILAVALLLGAMSPAVYAACEVLVQVTYIDTPFGDPPTVYGRPLFVTLPKYVYYFNAVEEPIIQACQAAWISGKPVKIFGDAASCPTANGERFGGIITQVESYN